MIVSVVLNNSLRLHFFNADWTVRVEVCWGQIPPHPCLPPLPTTPSPQ